MPNDYGGSKLPRLSFSGLSLPYATCARRLSVTTFGFKLCVLVRSGLYCFVCGHHPGREGKKISPPHSLINPGSNIGAKASIIIIPPLRKAKDLRSNNTTQPNQIARKRGGSNQNYLGAPGARTMDPDIDGRHHWFAGSRKEQKREEQHQSQAIGQQERGQKGCKKAKIQKRGPDPGIEPGTTCKNPL